MSSVLTDKFRIFIGGLNEDTTEEKIRKRFGVFGDVISVNLTVRENIIETGKRKAFAHLDVSFTEYNWKKCQDVYNNANWNGSKIRIEKAKTNQFLEGSTFQKVEPETKTSKKSWFEHAADMSLVSEENCSDRKGWVRSKQGRPVRKMKIRTLNRELIFVDPLKHKNNIEIFYFGNHQNQDIHWTYKSFDGDTDFPFYSQETHTAKYDISHVHNSDHSPSNFIPESEKEFPIEKITYDQVEDEEISLIRKKPKKKIVRRKIKKVVQPTQFLDLSFSEDISK